MMTFALKMPSVFIGKEEGIQLNGERKVGCLDLILATSWGQLWQSIISMLVSIIPHVTTKT